MTDAEKIKAFAQEKIDQTKEHSCTPKVSKYGEHEYVALCKCNLDQLCNMVIEMAAAMDNHVVISDECHKCGEATVRYESPFKNLLTKLAEGLK